jgi:exodeoxyribonuclease VII large subunit
VTIHRTINRLQQLLDDKESRMRNALARAMGGAKARRLGLEERLRYYDVRPRLERAKNRLDALGARATRAVELRLGVLRRRCEMDGARIEQLSPLRVLDRGYAIVSKKNGGILKDPAVIAPGTALDIRLARGRMEAESK